MRLAFTFTTAITALARKKSRTALTMLGIVIGIASVIIIMSVGASAQELILGQIRGVGTNLIAVLPGAADEKGPPAAALGITITTLTRGDVEAITERRNAPHVVAATGYVRGVVGAQWRERDLDVNIMGVMASYPQVEEAPLAMGRFFSAEEEKSQARVAVIGPEIQRNLFGDSSPLGQQIKLQRHNFTVIGVLEPRGTRGFQTQDNYVIVPLATAQKNILSIDHVSFIRARVDDERNIDQAKQDIAATLRERHDIRSGQPDDFDIRDQRQQLDVLMGITDALKIFLAAIAAISLIVGGIGIMNVMLVSVLERTREIGLRKAIGASVQAILTQFLMEAVLLTLVGAVVGILVGVVVAYLVSIIAGFLGYEWVLIIPITSVLLACVVAVGIGLTFGVYPARRAARMDPIEALRYE